MCRLLVILLLLLVSPFSARAHVGKENDTEVRVFSNGMRMVVRTSMSFAWNLLGERAPMMADEAGQAVARPMLIAKAPELVSVRAGGKPVTPSQADCAFEVDRGVAFILTFERPAEWPVEVEAHFFNGPNSLEMGSIRVFDYSASPFGRDFEPIAEKAISGGDPVLVFSLGENRAPAPEKLAVAPVPALPAAAVGNSAVKGKVVGALVVLICSAVGVGILVRRRLGSGKD